MTNIQTLSDVSWQPLNDKCKYIVQKSEFFYSGYCIMLHGNKAKQSTISHNAIFALQRETIQQNETESLVTRTAEGKHSKLNLTRHKHSTAWCFQCLFQHCHSHPHLFAFKKATCHSIKNTRRDKAVYSIHKYPFKRAVSVICHWGLLAELKLM